MSNGNVKVRSSISDEELAMLIENDKKRNPSDFSCGPVVFVNTPSVCNLKAMPNPSRTFETIRKWL